MDPADRREIYVSVRANGNWSARYFALLALSTVIASFGLLANSTAVVIGAMIIAPLMGPILGLSMGIVVGSTLLERRALLAEILGVALCLAIGYGIGSLPYLPEISPEILARTTPTAFDIAVALASGLAAAYASVNPKVGSALAGVAIAVALVPPLASSGILFAHGEVRLGIGAFVLWLTNFLSIELASVVVFVLYGFAGYRGAGESQPRRLLAHLAPSIVALLLVSWYLTHTLVRLVNEENDNTLVRSVLSEQIAQRSGGMLQDVRIDRSKGTWSIVATALTPQPFEPAQVSSMQEALRDAGIAQTKLIVRSLVSEDMGADGRAFVSELEKSRTAQAAQDARELEKVRQILERQFRTLNATELVEVRRGVWNGEPVFTAVVRSPDPVVPSDVASAERTLSESTGYRSKLIVRSLIALDADSEKFLHQAVEAPEPAELLRLRERIRPIIERRLGTEADTTVTSVSVRQAALAIVVNASLESARPIDPAILEGLQSDLVRHIDPRILLTARTDLVYGFRPGSVAAARELPNLLER